MADADSVEWEIETDICPEQCVLIGNLGSINGVSYLLPVEIGMIEKSLLDLLEEAELAYSQNVIS
jgi:hypothetical protein